MTQPPCNYQSRYHGSVYASASIPRQLDLATATFRDGRWIGRAVLCCAPTNAPMSYALSDALLCTIADIDLPCYCRLVSFVVAVASSCSIGVHPLCILDRVTFRDIKWHIYTVANIDHIRGNNTVNMDHHIHPCTHAHACLGACRATGCKHKILPTSRVCLHSQ